MTIVIMEERYIRSFPEIRKARDFAEVFKDEDILAYMILENTVNFIEKQAEIKVDHATAGRESVWNLEDVSVLEMYITSCRFTSTSMENTELRK